MFNIFRLDQNAITPLYQQIKDSVIDAIHVGKVKMDDRLPSIHGMCREFGLSPGTVAKAYDELRKQGIIASRQGKGFCIASVNTDNKLNIFLLFDRLNSYKEILFSSFVENLGNQAKVDIYFHHYDIKRFEHLILENLGNYHFYAVMPHFNEDVTEIIRKIPEDKLLVLDKPVENLEGNYISVCQDFHHDILNALVPKTDIFRKYKSFNFVEAVGNPFQFIPDGCLSGFAEFCDRYSIPNKFIERLEPEFINKNEAYLVFAEHDLIQLIKVAEQNGYKLGKDLGIITYDDTPVKEVLAGGITTVSTDFYEMGRFAADCILNKKKEKKFNPFKLILRNSL
ncbi:MAG: GntR family transcriptional regulator [Bacteroidales bacterium]